MSVIQDRPPVPNGLLLTEIPDIVSEQASIPVREDSWDRVARAFEEKDDASAAGSLPLNKAERQVLLALGDGLSAAVGCVGGYILWEHLVGRNLVVPKLGPAFFAIAWIVALFLVDGYEVQIPASRIRSLAVVVKAIPIAAFSGFLAFFAEPYRMTRPVIVLSIAIGALLIVGTRWTIARALLHERFAKRTVLIGTSNRLSADLAAALRAARFDYRVVAVVDVVRRPQEPSNERQRLSNLRGFLQRHDAHEVIVANDDTVAARTAIEACFSQGIRIVSARDLVERYEGRVPIDWVDDSWFLALPAQGLTTRPYLAVRRLVDIVLAAAIGLPFLIVLPLLAALIRIDSAGPVFFRQRRLGQFGREFDIPKLRSMRSDAELTGHRWAQRDDPRVTRVGRFLRLTRLDEVPQVLNVLKGQMSFIGPRPERPEFVREIEREVPHYRARLAVKPGISGWAQVKSGYAASMADTRRKLEYDLYYVKNQSLGLDLQIVLHTLFTVLGLRGR
jgi:exopolysaccharide biosynthesis polyprenyl glycosylphosphotransferase